MAFLDGKAKPSGGNVQRENFNKAAFGGKPKPESKTATSHEPEDGGSKTTITHHEDGSHTVMHHDGETTEHPSMGHAAMGLAAKHDAGGDHGHIHNHGGMAMHEGMGPEHTVTTHHVGMDGEVQGPHHHEGMEPAMAHLAGAMGGEESPMMAHGDGGEESGDYV